ncbi:MAG: hypothetical protein SWK90_14340 [Chloroflexota bacterium]|nr:hypothetical protein [Chloroflexota bacterium]
MNDNSLHSLHTSTSREYYIDSDARIADLADRQAGFSDYVDRRWHDLSVRQLARVLTVHGQTAVRLGRLLRDRRGMGGLGGPPVSIDAIIADLDDKLGRLSQDTDERWPELDSENVKPWGTLVTVYSQNCVRLGQLMCTRRDLREASSSDELDADMDAAIACLSEAWGIEL